MFCPHCGANVPDGSKFCSNCGNSIDAQGGGGYSQQPQTPPIPGYYEQPEPTQSYGSAPMGATPLRTDRDLLTYILLTFITCGIYGYWFVYQLAQDANVACYEDGEETPGLVVYILLSIVTCGIYSYYWIYKLANRIQNNGPRYGVTIQESGSDVLLWMVLGYFTCSITTFVAMNMVIKNMNALCDGYNRAFGLM